MFNYDNELKPRIKRNPCKKGYWKSIPSIQKAFVNRLLINNTVGPSEAKQHKGENHRDQAGENIPTDCKQECKQTIIELLREGAKRGGKKPSRKCQPPWQEGRQLNPSFRKRQKFPKLEKAAEQKPHKKEKTKWDISNKRKKQRQKIPIKNSQAYDCRHPNLQSKTS